MILPSTLAILQLDSLFEKYQHASDPTTSEPNAAEGSRAPPRRSQKRKPTATVKPMTYNAFSVENLMSPEKKPKLEVEPEKEPINNNHKSVIMDLLNEDCDVVPKSGVDEPEEKRVEIGDKTETEEKDKKVEEIKSGEKAEEPVEAENVDDKDDNMAVNRPDSLEIQPSTSHELSPEELAAREVYCIPDETSQDVRTPDSDATVAAFDFSQDIIMPVSPLVIHENNCVTMPTVPPLKIRIPMRSRANSRLRPSPPMLSDKVSPTQQAVIVKRRSSEKENVNKVDKVSPRKRANSTKKSQKPLKAIKIRKCVWSPVGQSIKKRVYLNNDTIPVYRECFPQVIHKCGVALSEKDNVTVNVGDDTGPSVAKISHIFVDPESGSLMASVVWYYREPQLELTPDPAIPMFHAHEREVLASKHIDIIRLDSVNEQVSVTTYNEYCRYIAENKQDAQLIPVDHEPVWPRGEEGYRRRNKLPREDTPPETVYFCRAMYDFKGHKVLRHFEPKDLLFTKAK